MAGILKFFGATVIVVCLLGFLLSLLTLLGAFGHAASRGQAGLGIAGLVAGGLGSVFAFAGGMAVGAVCYVGGRALDHMDGHGPAGRRPMHRRSRRAILQAGAHGDQSQDGDAAATEAPVPRRVRRR